MYFETSCVMKNIPQSNSEFCLYTPSVLKGIVEVKGHILVSESFKPLIMST